MVLLNLCQILITKDDSQKFGTLSVMDKHIKPVPLDIYLDVAGKGEKIRVCDVF
jgi:hypothetical protein